MKLFGSILDSTVWFEDDSTRLVWVTMLAMADSKGYVGASVPGIANRARVTVEQAEKALAVFLAPDPRSRSKEHDGRRIAEVERGWVLLNYLKFREQRDQETRRAQYRESKARARVKSKARREAESFDMTTKGELAPAEVYEEQDDMAWTRQG